MSCKSKRYQSESPLKNQIKYPFRVCVSVEISLPAVYSINEGWDGVKPSMKEVEVEVEMKEMKAAT